MSERKLDRVAVKVLKAVEVDPRRSNQHELNGVSAFKKLLGAARLENVPCTFRYLADQVDSTIEDHGWVSWYDSREKHATRSEYRLYYPKNRVMDRAEAEDLLVLVWTGDEVELHIAAAGSTTASQLRWLLGLEEDDVLTQVHDTAGLVDRTRLVTHLPLFDHLGIEAPSDDEADLELLFKKFPAGLPTTAEFAAFARSRVDQSIIEDPDEALRRWTTTEEFFFRAIERLEISQRLDVGFRSGGDIDVDGFIAFSLSIQNRRKARAGRSLELHVRAILEHRGIQHEFEPVTENNSKPDYLLPSIAEYRDPSFPASDLRMLAVKTTCKDRWRQVLAEADRIDRKHLLTLEPAISLSQTNEMVSHDLQLVLPRHLHQTYTDAQRANLLNVEEALLEFEAVA